MSATEIEKETVSQAPTEHHGPTASGHGHPTDALYVRVFVVLFVITALEVSTYYVDFGPLFLPALLIMMAIKFFIVVSFFMHLRFDSKLFGRVFWAGLILAVAVYVGALSAFQFWA